MKKLISLSFFFAVLGLLFVGCQSNENITSPTDELNKPTPPPVYVYNCDPTALSSGGTVTVDLVAGQHNVVGSATFTLTGAGNLEIAYNLNGGVGTITEVHIDFATALNNDAANGGFHANSQGSPQPGHFDINTTSGASSWSTTVLKADLLNYLNLPAGSDVPDHFYIAAHGVVSYATSGGEGVCPTLPNGKYRYLKSVPGANYYAENMKLFNDALGTDLYMDNLNGWCVDRQNGAMGGKYVQVDFLCSTDDISGLCLVDKPDNIGAVNWLLNNKNYGGTSTARDIQVTIWLLLDNNVDPFNAYDTARVDYLYNEAIKHLDFVPGCGDVIGVYMFETGKDYCDESGMQVFLVEQTVECGSGGSDTMWGFNYDNGPVEGESCLFVDPGNWARYFQF